MIVFYDIAEHPIDTECEVDRLWKDLKNEYVYKEIMKNRNQRWARIGILYLNPGSDRKMAK